MRPWWNWQTRTFEGRMRERTGSSPVGRTRIKLYREIGGAFIIKGRYTVYNKRCIAENIILNGAKRNKELLYQL
jgi:hypothetical protein